MRLSETNRFGVIPRGYNCLNKGRRFTRVYTPVILAVKSSRLVL